MESREGSEVDIVGLAGLDAQNRHLTMKPSTARVFRTDLSPIRFVSRGED